MEEKNGYFPSAKLAHGREGWLLSVGYGTTSEVNFIENTYITESSQRLKHKHPNPEARI
jgi:hypothetical protein